MKRKSRSILITVLCLVVAAAIGFGLWFFAFRDSGATVYVYPFEYLGMTEYWGDSQSSYGPVSTDKIQTVFLSETQKVVEILVNEGDTVKKGDLLMVFDTTLNDLALERERLEVEKLKLRLSDAEAYLKEIKGMKPMVIPKPTEPQEPDENQGAALQGAYQISQDKAYDGSSQEKALICWAGENTPLDEELLEALRAAAQTYQQANRPATEPTEPTQTPEAQTGEEPSEEAPTEAPTEEPAEPPVEEPTEPEPVDVRKYYVVIKVTQGDKALAPTKTWQGLEVTGSAERGFSFRFFDASMVTDHTLAQPSAPSVEPEIDFGSGFTAAQLAQMRSEQEKTIRDLQFQVKMAEADYKIKQTEVADGNIYAQIDGTVTAVLSEEEAMETMAPILKVSGGGGFYVQCTVSELEKEQLRIGQEVSVNDWNSGMVYTGTVRSVGDFPSRENNWNGMGNPNVSYYPFTVFVDESADLQSGSYVDVTYSTATSQQGIYLENPFLRTENGQHYVYVQGADGLLEKRFVTVGKSLWGSYTQILEGITAEDLLAFPYGKDVKDGAKAVESDYSTLYG